MGQRYEEGVRWYDVFAWREAFVTTWHHSVVITMVPGAPAKGQPYKDVWTVWATPLCGRMPNPDDPHISACWPNSRWASVPALLMWCIIELDRLMGERQAERRGQAMF